MVFSLAFSWQFIFPKDEERRFSLHDIISLILKKANMSGISAGLRNGTLNFDVASPKAATRSEFWTWLQVTVENRAIIAIVGYTDVTRKIAGSMIGKDQEQEEPLRPKRECRRNDFLANATQPKHARLGATFLDIVAERQQLNARREGDTSH
jgi:hypothetical protein